jgi:hypothetical protein
MPDCFSVLFCDPVFHHESVLFALFSGVVFVIYLYRAVLSYILTLFYLCMNDLGEQQKSKETCTGEASTKHFMAFLLAKIAFVCLVCLPLTNDMLISTSSECCYYDFVFTQ